MPVTVVPLPESGRDETNPPDEARRCRGRFNADKRRHLAPAERQSLAFRIHKRDGRVTQYANCDDNRLGDRIQVMTACSRPWAFEHINTLRSAGYVFV